MATFIRNFSVSPLKRNIVKNIGRQTFYFHRNSLQCNIYRNSCTSCVVRQTIYHENHKLHHLQVSSLRNFSTQSIRTVSSRSLFSKNSRILSSPSGVNFLGVRKYNDFSPADNSGLPPSDESQQRSLTPVTVPDYFPNVPVIAISNNPVYPKFVKMIEVTDKDLISLLKRKTRLGLPYAGVFLKKDESVTSDLDADESDVVRSLDSLHKVGVFVQITEMMDIGETLRLFVVAHRIIKINKVLDEDEDIDPLQQQITDLADKVYSSTSRREKRRRLKESGKEAEKEATPSQEEDPAASDAASDKSDKDDSDKDDSRTKVLFVETDNCDLVPYVNDDKMKAMTSEVIKTIKDIISMNPLWRENIATILSPANKVMDNPVFIANLGAMLTSSDSKEKQEVLEEQDIPKKMSLVLNMLKKEYERCQMQKRIGEEVEKKIREKNSQFMLKEQLKIIRKKLGYEKSESASLKEKFEERLKGKTVPTLVQQTIDEEMGRLQYLDGETSEFNTVRHYLDWLTILPWGVQSEEKLDIEHAHEVLEEDHYGMKDIKERILEFIAVSKLKGDSQGKIMCFHGPPGVGKTSIAKSIARSLNRKYFRFSVGGLNDVAEIKGHRRTYIGSMPGKMVQCLKRVGCENPLVLIDEVDKMGTRSFEGDAVSALLELLDPEQNTSFLDHYLDVPVDVSKVLFICTANVTHTIPNALKDRMELIELSGYTGEEKLMIAQRYLMPKALEQTGLKKEQISISEEALKTLIQQYCRESGVRNLQKKIEKIYRKVALKLVKSSEQISVSESLQKVDVTLDNLSDFVGNPLYPQERLYTTTPPGVVTGLAWTANGGSPLYIEVVKYEHVHLATPESSEVTTEAPPPSAGGLQVTGNLKDVMKESTAIAYTYARSWMQQNYPNNNFFSTSKLHIHFPEGATPKDGPSAGCAITTALLSLAMNQPCRQDMAMTGEISLTGKVLTIGGIKEKVLAAGREGIKTVIMPYENKPHFDELESFLKEGLDVHFVKHYSEVFDISFPKETTDSEVFDIAFSKEATE